MGCPSTATSIKASLASLHLSQWASVNRTNLPTSRKTVTHNGIPQNPWPKNFTEKQSIEKKQQEGGKKSTKAFWHFYRPNQPEKPYLPSEYQKMPERNKAYHAPVVWPVAAWVSCSKLWSERDRTWGPDGGASMSHSSSLSRSKAQQVAARQCTIRKRSKHDDTHLDRAIGSDQASCSCKRQNPGSTSHTSN